MDSAEENHYDLIATIQIFSQLVIPIFDRNSTGIVR